MNMLNPLFISPLLYVADELLDNECDDTKEIWVQKKPKKGDHIRVQRSGGLYAHHGIYVSDSEVIHFTGNDDDSILDWSKPEVIATDLATFLKGDVLEVKEYTDEEFPDLYTPEQIVTYARACIGDRGYDLLFNNCEHFANVCTLGRFRSNQVERVFAGEEPVPENREDKPMGLFKMLSNFFFGKSNSESSNHSSPRETITREPDKVRIAEIEADNKVQLADLQRGRLELEANNKLQLADMERERIELEAKNKIQLEDMKRERIELYKQAKLEIMECQVKSQIAIEEARAKGFTVKAQTLVALRDKLNQLAERQLLIIEKGAFPIVKEIEAFYSEMGEKIKAENDDYSTKKLPTLLSILEQYDENSPAYKLYLKRIESDTKMQDEYCQKQLDNIAKRQEQVLAGLITSKERIVDQTNEITNNMLKQLSAQEETLKLSGNTVASQNQLSNQTTKALEHKSAENK